MAYEFAANKAKLDRAVKWAKEQETAGGPKATEEVIKARYIAIAGLVIEDSEEVETEEEEIAPKKKGKKASSEEVE